MERYVKPLHHISDVAPATADDTTVYDNEGQPRIVHINDVFRGLLKYIDPTTGREGTHETPARAAKAWKFWCSGYDEDPAEILKVFEDGSEGYDQMVTVKDIPVYSQCEHHLASIFGTATISYIPNGRVVGLSKLSRLVNVYARRLQVQERMTVQIADALVEHLGPLGVGVTMRCRHLCMESRGICQQGHHTVTTALRGCIRDEPGARAEFMAVSAP
jgi:GTP cyclohydrolase I